MAARKSKIDLNKLTPEEREAHQRRLEAARAPREAYLVYEVNSDGETITAHLVTRDPKVVMKTVSGQSSKKYIELMIK